jgi:hypothetical protein
VPAARLAAPDIATLAVLNPGVGAASFAAAQFVVGERAFLPAIHRGP